MSLNIPSKSPKRHEQSVIIHFDYDCFYASVFEAETPALKSLPLAVQQKQIIVTCNYEARRRGLYKLQLIKEAKKACPDVVIVLGEDLTRFRNASKELYNFLRAFSWNGKAERLGFDEVFMDVSDIIEYNLGLLNENDLEHSFFCLSKDDPTAGFAFDALRPAGHTYPQLSDDELSLGAEHPDPLRLRLHLGSHLAWYLRHQLEGEKGYTCTVGISTSKLLSKLVGNLHKPKDQTVLMPPYNADAGTTDNVTTFIDGHEIGKIPGIGFKLAHKIRQYVLQRPPDFDTGLVYGGTKENVLVSDVRRHPGMGSSTLDRILGGPGTPQGIGAKVWALINAVDDSEVGQAREVPKQISIEDSYVRLDTLDEVLKELRTLARSLINRMHLDLLEDDEDDGFPTDVGNTVHDRLTEKPTRSQQKWLAHPRTVRLSTRPRPPPNPDGSRSRNFARISRSASMPNFIFNLTESIDALAERLVTETLVPMFRKLHPEKSGWNLSLVNVAATNMADTAGEGKGKSGRDISKMFKRQDDVLKQWKVEDRGEPPDAVPDVEPDQHAEPAPKTSVIYGLGFAGSEDLVKRSQESHADDGMGWESEDEDMVDDTFQCHECGARMPMFAMAAHGRWHSNSDR